MSRPKKYCSAADVTLVQESATLLRTVHELYDSGPAGPGGPGLRGAGGPSGFLQLQQRWLRERRHSDMLVAAHRAMQVGGGGIQPWAGNP